MKRLKKEMETALRKKGIRKKHGNRSIWVLFQWIWLRLNRNHQLCRPKGKGIN